MMEAIWISNSNLAIVDLRYQLDEVMTITTNSQVLHNMDRSILCVVQECKGNCQLFAMEAK